MSFDLSVIIPTYNRRGLIGETLDSVLSQSLPAAEVIVVDDGSSDGTDEFVRSRYPAVKLISIPNSGAPAARNAGVAASRCPWIAFLDSDDLWLPDYLAVHAQLAAAAPDVAYWFGNFRLVESGRWLTRTKFDEAPARFFDCRGYSPAPGTFVSTESMQARLLRFQPVFVSTLVMKRDYFEGAGRWDESLGRTASEDLEFSLRCVDRPPVGIIEAPLVGVRVHGASFSGDLRRCVEGEIAVLEYAARKGALSQESKRILAQEIGARKVKLAICRLPRPFDEIARRTLRGIVQLTARMRVLDGILHRWRSPGRAMRQSGGA